MTDPVAIGTALGIGAILQALVARWLGRPGPSGADGRLADAQADHERAQAETLAWSAIRVELDRLTARVELQQDALARLRDERDALAAQVRELVTEVARLRDVEVADKRRIAELETRVRELEARAGGTG